jgi:hypothetical protein
MILANVPDCPADKARAIARVADSVRSEPTVAYPLALRTLNACAQYIASGYNESFACEVTIVNAIDDPSQRDDVRGFLRYFNDGGNN